MDIYTKIDEIGEYIDQAKMMPVINQKLLDTDYIMKLLEELYACVPAEVREAREALRLHKQREQELERSAEELMERTKEECEKLLSAARKEAQRMVDQSEVLQRAEGQAKEIQNELLEQVDVMRKEVLADVEGVRTEALEKAHELEEAAQNRCRELRMAADQYAEDVLNHVDATLSQIQAVSKNTRRFMIEQKESDIIQKAVLN